MSWFNFFNLSLFYFCYQLQEQNTVPSLRKALKDVAMEKDAAVVARVQTMCTKCCHLMLLFNFLPSCTHKVSSISVGGSVCTASYAQETDKGSRGGTVSSMQSVSMYMQA